MILIHKLIVPIQYDFDDTKFKVLDSETLPTKSHFFEVFYMYIALHTINDLRWGIDQ